MTAALEDRALLAQAGFRALLRALASPGRAVVLRAPPGGDPIMALAEVLLDHEVSFATIGDGLTVVAARELAEQVRLRTGARPGDRHAAQFAFVFGAAGPALRDLPVGDLEFPDRGATLIWPVDGFGHGVVVALAGPGVAGRVRLELAGPARADLEALGTINRAYPRGLDTFFVDPGGTVVGVPRSIRLVLED